MATYYVIPTGNDTNNGTTTSTPWATMTKVTSHSFSAGDIINCAGTFTDELLPATSGSAGNPITFQQWSGQLPWKINGNNTLNTAVSIQIRSYVNISNLECYNCTHNAFLITSGVNCTFSNLSIHDSGTAGQYYAGLAIDGSNTNSGLIFNNIATYNCQGAGFQGAGVINGLTLNSCTSYHNGLGIGEEGFEFYCQNQTTTTGWTNLTGNIYYVAPGTPLTGNAVIFRVLNLTSSVELTYNPGAYATLSTNQWDFHSGDLYINIGSNPNGVTINYPYWPVQNVVLNNCISYNNVNIGGEGQGIEFDNFCNSCSCNWCIVYGNDDGISCNQSTNCTFNYCLSYNNTNDGFFSGEFTYGNTWYNCTSVGNAGNGFNLYNPSNLSAAYTLRNNISYNNGTHGITGTTGQTGIDENYCCSYGNGLGNWGPPLSQASHDISSNPLFINLSSNNYKLQSTSPCIGMGTNVGLAQDIIGTSVPQANRYDIGCYEYPSSIYYISTSGNDSNSGTVPLLPWATMTKASNQAYISGNVINCAGTFTDVLNLLSYSNPPNWTSQTGGSSGNPIIFQQWPSKSQWAINGNNSLTNCILIQGVSYFTISGVNTYGATQSAVEISNDSNCMFTNINAYSSGTSGSSNAAIYQTSTSTSSGNIFSNCASYNNQSSGFQISGPVNGLTLNSCTAYNNGIGTSDEGFEFLPGTVTYTSGWSNLSGNIYYQAVSLVGNEAVGRVIDTTDSLELLDSPGNYSSLSSGQWDFHSGNLYINIGGSTSGKSISFSIATFQNVFLNNCISYSNIDYNGSGQGNGFDFDNFSSNITASGCISYSNPGRGFVLNWATNCSLVNCLSYGNVHTGFIANNYCGGLNYYNCVSEGNGSHGGFFIDTPISPLSTGFNIENCIAYNNSSYGIGATNGASGIVENYCCSYANPSGNWYEAIGQNANDISANPLFLSVPLSNYRLQVSSPCIGAGTNSGVTSDFYGTVIPQAGRYDIGLYEYPSTVYYVNSSSGSDSNNGETPLSPFKTMTKVSKTTLTPNNIVNCTGTFTDALVIGNYMSGYGVPQAGGTSGNPITIQQWPLQPSFSIAGNSSLSNCIWIYGLPYMNVSSVFLSGATNSGILLQETTSGTYIGITSNSNSSSGISIQNSTSTASNVIFNSCTSYNNGSAGFNIYAIANGVSYNYCTAYNNGLNIGDEGFEFGPPNTSVTSGWTNLSGNIYYRTVSITSPQSMTRVIDMTDVAELTNNPGNFASLATNQWDYESGTSRLYINIGKSPSGITISYPTGVAQNISVNYCTSYNAFNYAGAQEGHGINFDNFSSNSSANWCTCYGCAGHGFQTNWAKNIKFNYCLSYRNNEDGFHANSYSTNVSFYNCTSSFNTINGFSLGPHCPLGNFTIENCISYENGSYGISGSVGITGITENYCCSYGNTSGGWNGSISEGSHDISSNPQFVSPAGNNFRLLSNSPCIGIGISGVLYSDMDGKHVPIGVGYPLASGYDLGCYEFGLKDYTSQSVISLPTNDSELTYPFVELDYLNVSSSDYNLTSQLGSGNSYADFLFKDQNNAKTPIIITWTGQTNRSPVISEVYLQIYNRTTPGWETVASNSIALANSNFTLTGSPSSAISNYYDSNNFVTSRVYQEGI